MKKKVLYLVLFFIHIICFAQNKNKILSDGYISGELIYRSYGTNGHLGFGGGVEISKDLKKWFGIGVNLSYWQDKKLDWNFKDPFSGTRYKYYGQIQEYKISPFVQFIPLNTKHVDFYIQGGLRTGYFNQKYYTGGYTTSYELEEFYVFVEDTGYKGVTLGYELGAALRFQFNRVMITPSVLISNDLKENSYSSLNLKLGWQLD